MLQPPPIVITHVDNTRLRRMLSAPRARDTDAADALEEELDRANVVEPTALPIDVVSMNSTVRLLECRSGRERELTLVYPRDAGEEGRVSVLAPMGSALLGLRVGSEIEWPLPNGRTARIRVLDLRHQPEAAGEDLAL
ncbi:nucleoside diphosphate kinase regulator [Enhygromyxa salina]|uniref:Regulator of nucleoside diphosphate kinase n=1 Tax=Enhygromyxa salina TaxID=215803 RepID=A0A2S9YJF1_9BACT|nr:nucleoside diphosphate kinase regulator [Enhygromyxa salina]PRQ05233.1 Regulator of nucleoside diphosphate kinase [Enhygromyxa salina]